MATENITISKQGLLKAYRQAEPEQKKLLENMFGKETFAINFNVMDRVKTFQDAVQELGDDNKLVAEYQTIYDCNGDNLSPDLLAYFKLRIIVAALNEGWEPQFTEDEYRWYPWFYLYTKEEYEELNEKDKTRCVLRSGGYSVAGSGLAYASAARHRTRARASVVGSPSEAKNSQPTQVGNSRRFTPNTSFSSSSVGLCGNCVATQPFPNK